MAIMGLDGKPLQNKQKKAVRGKDMVAVGVGVSDLAKFEASRAMPVHTPQGVVSIDPKSAITNMMTNFYHIMRSTGQKEMVIRIEDTSLDSVTEKQMEVNLFSINKEESIDDAVVEKDENTQVEENDEVGN